MDQTKKKIDPKVQELIDMVEIVAIDEFGGILTRKELENRVEKEG